MNEDYAPSETCSTTSRQSLAGFRAGFMSHGDPSKKPAAKSLGPKKVKSGGIKSKFLSGGASGGGGFAPPTRRIIAPRPPGAVRESAPPRALMMAKLMMIA